jgi:hypothetical protein
MGGLGVCVEGLITVCGGLSGERELWRRLLKSHGHRRFFASRAGCLWKLIAVPLAEKVGSGPDTIQTVQPREWHAIPRPPFHVGCRYCIEEREEGGGAVPAPRGEGRPR